MASVPENMDEARGRLKKAAGEITDDEQLKQEGVIDKVAGTAKGLIDKAVEKARNVTDRR